ncbi:MAG: esterase/lipase family protein [Steroidobacteraceae bacterium]
MNNAVVVFVHGLWMMNLNTLLLRQRVRSGFGFDCEAFHYSAHASTPAQIVARLGDFVGALRAERLHFVGHSLGGLIVMRYLAEALDLPPGRAVLLGAPVVRSRAAERLAETTLGRAMLGPTGVEELAHEQGRTWSGTREIGCIAGNSRFGLGHVIGRIEDENDGSVGVDETRLAGARDHLVLPVSHTGMLFSVEVAHQVGQFLGYGRFDRTPQSATIQPRD